MTVTQPQSGAFASGSLVRARGREWVVQPESDGDLLVLRPLGGTDDEVAGIYLPLEPVEPAQFDLPDPTRVGDDRSARLLRDAVRLGFRSSAGPFRSFGQIAVEPRPYQLVPLLMALRLDPVRLLIADDVGIGKTVEAGLIARELLDRGEVQRMAVLCPPHLAEQWQAELRDKFHIDAELVLPGTVSRLERGIGVNESIFDVYPHVIVSIDFIKSDKRRADFLLRCPELVIVDEAHTAAFGETGRGGKHQRHTLVRGVAADASRHLILVTATPHSGNEEAFRSLLEFLNPSFAELPDDLSGSANEAKRRELARYFVQRRRSDIRSYLDANTPFPARMEIDETYNLTPEYQRLFDRVLAYARESVRDPAGGDRRRQRVRWWSALALLRSLGSSPAAASATLRSRAATADTQNPDEADEIGRRLVFDIDEDEGAERLDVAPGADTEDDADAGRTRRRLLEMARDADALHGKGDAKLQRSIQLVRRLVDDGFNPIVFCRFIPTAEYVAEALRGKVGKGVEVTAITGNIPHDEREARVLELAAAEQRVLVCTDCLSEGINLQEHFDAVMHYDLSWNPTRHEQREGRVDRYGQPKSEVRVVTYFGTDNQIDGIVLRVLLRKHKEIRKSLGISVPVPGDTNQLMEAIFEGLILHEQQGFNAQRLPGFDDFFAPKQRELFGEWENAADREKRSRTLFAQEAIHVDEVRRELEAARSAIGSGVDVARFTEDALKLHNAVVSQSTSGTLRIDLTESPRALRDTIGYDGELLARFELPVPDNVAYLTRTHPLVEGLAAYVMDTTLDPIGGGRAARAGVIRTRAVSTRTTLLLVRYRFHILGSTRDGSPLLAEDVGLLGFESIPAQARWLTPDAAEALLAARPDANILQSEAATFIQRVVDGMPDLEPHLNDSAMLRASELLDAHRRVRQATASRSGAGATLRVEPQLPIDVLGIYVYVPA